MGLVRIVSCLEETVRWEHTGLETKRRSTFIELPAAIVVYE